MCNLYFRVSLIVAVLVLSGTVCAQRFCKWHKHGHSGRIASLGGQIASTPQSAY